MKPLQIALAVLAAALVGALGWLTDWGQDFGDTQRAEKPVAAKADPTSVLPDFKLGSESAAYAVIAERPLLSPSRAPAPTQPIQATAPEPPKPQIRRGLYQLIGVSDYGSVKVAQVRELAGGKVRSVKVGDSLQEMRVAKINANDLTLEFQGETDVMQIARFTASGRVPAPPPVQPTLPPPQPVAAAPAPQLPFAQPVPAQPSQPMPGNRVSADAAANTNTSAETDAGLEARRARRAALDASRPQTGGPRPGFGPGPRQ